MIVTMTTSISLHVKDEKEDVYGTRREIKFWEKERSRCVINIYMAKLKVHAPTFNKKGKQL